MLGVLNGALSLGLLTSIALVWQCQSELCQFNTQSPQWQQETLKNPEALDAADSHTETPFQSEESQPAILSQSLPHFIVSELDAWGLTVEHITAEQWRWFLEAQSVQRFGNWPIGESEGVLEFYLRQHNYQMITWLVERGFDLDQVTRYGPKPLYYVAMYGTSEDFEFLVNAGASIEVAGGNDGQGFTGALSFNPSVVERERILAYLELMGYSLRTEEQKIKNELYQLDEHTDVANLLEKLNLDEIEASRSVLGELLVAGINLEQLETIAPETLTRLAESSWFFMQISDGYRSEQKVLDAVIDAGADINQSNETGFTPLMYAVMVGNVELTKYLLAKGADTTAANWQGKTAIQMLDSLRVTKIEQQLIEEAFLKYRVHE